MPADFTLTSVTIAAGTLGALITAGVSVREYVLKSRSERAETEIKLARLFAELVPIANARSDRVVSEAAITAIATANPGFTEDDLRRAVVPVTPGIPMQAAAIASLGQLGRTYSELRSAAVAALTSLEFVDEIPDLKQARQTALTTLTD